MLLMMVTMIIKCMGVIPLSSVQYTTRLCDILKSEFTDEFGDLAALEILDSGEFRHPNEIIDQQFNLLFKDMHILSNVSDDFKKEFCKRYWFDEIGFSTVLQFKQALETKINLELHPLLKAAEALRNLSLDDMQQDHDMRTDTLVNANNQALDISNTQPGNRREIVFTDKYGVIDYANALVENHGKQFSDTNLHSYGWSGRTKADDYNTFGLMTDLLLIAIEECRDLFMGVF